MFWGQNLKFTTFRGLVLFQLFLGYANLGGYFWVCHFYPYFFGVSVFKVRLFVMYF